MELTLDRTEVKTIILDWANAKWPDTFNHAEIGSSYGSDYVTLTKRKSDAQEDDK